MIHPLLSSELYTLFGSTMAGDISTFSNPAIFEKSLRAKSLRVNTRQSLINYFDNIDGLKVTTSDTRAIKTIYRHTMEQHALKPHMLMDNFVDKCSEMSILTKYWCPLLEAFFGFNDNMFLQW
ncbi:hypothetical protein BC941DRAFT_476632 [Chlamydoabsidia padenii]|nr:hypothetical protein BC941DRAFT_476632 [Chlamydoabsidia padenii]